MTYKICSSCIMDVSDSLIRFNDDGICDHCLNYRNNILPNWHVDDRGLAQLEKAADQIKRNGKSRDFDCIIGISGGLDSSYTAYVAKEVMGLRPLLYHVDAGWNTDQAVGNIEKLVDGLGLDLFTDVINWEEMKDLQVAFLRAGIPDQDIPQDCAFFSSLYKFARLHKISYVLTGGNFSTECCREPNEWGAYPGIDKTLILDIHRKFGTRPLKTFPIIDVFTYKVFYQQVLGMKVFKPLNHLPYIKKEAEALLSEKFGWMPFQHKHHESRFTRFYEDFWMPRKFGFEKRRAHFSSLILTGQITRDEALARIAKPEMSEDFITNEIDFVANKLGLTTDELMALFNQENKTFASYKNKLSIIQLGAKMITALGMERRHYR